MAEMVTRCPKCSTSFRITQAQIQKARGAVRCGSCLHIFNAQKHLVNGKATAKKAPTTPKAKPQARRPQAAKPKPAAPRQKPLDITPPEAPKPKRQTPPRKPASGGLKFDQEQINRESEIDDDILISDNMGAETDEETLYIRPKDTGISLFERKIEDKEEEEFVDETDESWAENLLEEEPDLPPRPEPRQEETSGFDSPLSIVGSEAEPPEPAPSDDSADADTGADESAAEAPPPPKFFITSDEEALADGYSEKVTAFDADRSAMLYNIDPEPVEMTAVSHRQWKKHLLWLGAILLALLILLGQVAWLQFDRFSRSETYRPYYSAACQLLGCQLPTLSDRKRIRTFNLVVRNHPDQAQALVVDAMILNSAPFEQSYPRLQLTFTDINNKPVASRTFTPQEYLKGELAGSKIMPRNQPIHISLELVDPGESAVNYRLDIR